jgi:hypothetical protein
MNNSSSEDTTKETTLSSQTDFSLYKSTSASSSDLYNSITPQNQVANLGTVYEEIWEGTTGGKGTLSQQSQKSTITASVARFEPMDTVEEPSQFDLSEIAPEASLEMFINQADTDKEIDELYQMYGITPQVRLSKDAEDIVNEYTLQGEFMSFKKSSTEKKMKEKYREIEKFDLTSEFDKVRRMGVSEKESPKFCGDVKDIGFEEDLSEKLMLNYNRPDSLNGVQLAESSDARRESDLIRDESDFVNMETPKRSRFSLELEEEIRSGSSPKSMRGTKTELLSSPEGRVVEELKKRSIDQVELSNENMVDEFVTGTRINSDLIKSPKRMIRKEQPSMALNLTKEQVENETFEKSEIMMKIRRTFSQIDFSRSIRKQSKESSIESVVTSSKNAQERETPIEPSKPDKIDLSNLTRRKKSYHCLKQYQDQLRKSQKEEDSIPNKPNEHGPLGNTDALQKRQFSSLEIELSDHKKSGQKVQKREAKFKENEINWENGVKPWSPERHTFGDALGMKVAKTVDTTLGLDDTQLDFSNCQQNYYSPYNFEEHQNNILSFSQADTLPLNASNYTEKTQTTKKCKNGRKDNYEIYKEKENFEEKLKNEEIDLNRLVLKTDAFRLKKFNSQWMGLGNKDTTCVKKECFVYSFFMNSLKRKTKDSGIDLLTRIERCEQKVKFS